MRKGPARLDPVVFGSTVYVKLAENARRGVEGGLSDEGVPEIGELVEKTKAKRDL